METFIRWLQNHASPCFYKSFFGHQCPGCGAQRALILLLKGELLASIKMYPALIPLLFLSGFVVSHLIFGTKNGTKYIKLGFVIVLSIIFISYFYKVFTTGV